MKRLSLIGMFATIAAALTLVACGSDSKSSSGGNVVGPNGTQCASGSVYIQQYNGCFPTQQCITAGYPSNYGYVSQINQCLQGSAITYQPGYGSGHLWSGNIAITNRDVYRRMLKDNWICDRPYELDLFQNNCDNWDDQAAVGFQVNSNSLPSAGAVIVYPYMMGTWSGFGSTQLPYQGQVYVTNGNTSFELQALGQNYAYNKVFTAVGNVGNIVANAQYVRNIRLNLTYNGTQFGYADIIFQY